MIKISWIFSELILDKTMKIYTWSNNETCHSFPNHSRYEFFNDLYHRFLLTTKIPMKCMCLQAMAIVYGKCYEDIGAFNDTKYIVQMLDRVRISHWSYVILILILIFCGCYYNICGMAVSRLFSDVKPWHLVFELSFVHLIWSSKFNGSLFRLRR